MYKLRFHLGQGQYFMFWQLRNKKLDLLDYYDPSDFEFTIKDGILKNSSTVAKQIFSGSNKTVCSWIQFSEGENVVTPSFTERMTQVSYNPRVKPYWTTPDNYDINLDGFRGEIIILNKTLYVKTDELNNFIKNSNT